MDGDKKTWFASFHESPADWFTGTVRVDPLLTRDRSITRRFPSGFAVYPLAFPARQ
jgi:hypothetical protein